MDQSQHARSLANRFRDILAQSDISLEDNHVDQLALLIESGLDSALLQRMEHIADKLETIAHGVRHDAEFFVKTGDD